MKKNNLLVGILYLLCGVICLVIALSLDTKLNSLLFGFSGAMIVPGIMMISKYLYWTAPKNKSKYAERLENEKIELHDERKEKLRDKSGRYAYVIGLLVTSFFIVLFSVLEKLEVITNSKLIILYLGGYLVFQYAVGIIIFRHLNNKY